MGAMLCADVPVRDKTQLVVLCAWATVKISPTVGLGLRLHRKRSSVTLALALKPTLLCFIYFSSLNLNIHSENLEVKIACLRNWQSRRRLTPSWLPMHRPFLSLKSPFLLWPSVNLVRRHWVRRARHALLARCRASGRLHAQTTVGQHSMLYLFLFSSSNKLS